MKNDVLLVTAEMGLGHIRALKPLEKIFKSEMLVLGQSNLASPRAKRIWRRSLRAYEWFSRASQWPIFGDIIFSFMEWLLHIEPFSVDKIFRKPTTQVKMVERYIDKGVCNEIDAIANGVETPVVTTFYATVNYMAKYHPFTPVFCQLCDTDISRVWVPSNPKNGNIYYMAPSPEVVERLRSYGVEDKRIHLTGFPIPVELIGGRGQEVAIENYEKRLSFLKQNKALSKNNPFRITYVLGGAGAMVHNGLNVANSLSKYIKQGSIEFTFVSNLSKKVTKELIKFQRINFKDIECFKVIMAHNLDDYFEKFNKEIKNTHILWTKPSELTFYSSLGIPIIMTPPLGPQEEANRNWLLSNNIGVDQCTPSQCDAWLIDLIESGLLWPMAKNGWINGNRLAAYSIEKIVESVLSTYEY